mgnify:FL=1|jgi:hypothetical protein
MKIALILYLCSYAAGECLPPHKWEKNFPDMYECMLGGYEASAEKILEIGRYEVNEYDMYIKFACIEISDEELGT